MRELFARRDRSADPGDRAFLARLLRTLGSETLDLPLFPDAAHALDRLIRTGDPPMAQVTALVRQEPDLVRRVWREASAASYARGVTHLDHAIARIGFQSLWRIAMAACFTAPVFRVPGYERPLRALRVRGLATADVAGWMADGDHGDAWLAGLLHGAGGLVVLRAAPAHRGKPAPDPAFVVRLARALEPPLGVLVAHTWGLSRPVVGAIGLYPTPDRASADLRPCARILRVARLAVLAALDGEAGQGGGARLLEADPGLLFDPERALHRATEALRDARV